MELSPERLLCRTRALRRAAPSLSRRACAAHPSFDRRSSALPLPANLLVGSASRRTLARSSARGQPQTPKNLNHGFTPMNTDHFESKTGATGLKHSAIREAIIGSFYDVYNELGHGFLESVYREALAVLLAERGQNVEQEKTVTVRFRNSIVGIFRTDLLVNNVVIVEPKCARALDSVDEAQLLNYLKATEFE